MALRLYLFEGLLILFCVCSLFFNECGYCVPQPHLHAAQRCVCVSPPHRPRLTASQAAVEEEEDGGGLVGTTGRGAEMLLRGWGIGLELGYQGASVLFLACGMGQ